MLSTEVLDATVEAARATPEKKGSKGRAFLLLDVDVPSGSWCRR